MSEQTKPHATVTVTGLRIEVRCPYEGTELARTSGTRRLRDLISSVVFAHERQCGRCDTREAYEQGSPDFLKSLEAEHTRQDQLDEKRAENQRGDGSDD